ncbi:MAG: hypothetical protein H6559_14260 [Lewinellaceae bacterium]|nr:hypothetical protein [Lewinellaceae bacterium]
MNIEKLVSLLQQEVHRLKPAPEENSFWLRPQNGEKGFIKEFPSNWAGLSSEEKASFLLQEWGNQEIAQALLPLIAEWLSEKKTEKELNHPVSEQVRDFIYEMF